MLKTIEEVSKREREISPPIHCTHNFILYRHITQFHDLHIVVHRLPELSDIGKQRMKAWGAAYLPLIKVLILI